MYEILVKRERGEQSLLLLRKISNYQFSQKKKKSYSDLFWWFSVSKNILEFIRARHFSSQDKKHISQNNQYIYHLCYDCYLGFEHRFRSYLSLSSGENWPIKFLQNNCTILKDDSKVLVRLLQVFSQDSKNLIKGQEFY